MSKKNVLIVGGTGYLGQHLLQAFSDTKTTSFHDISFTHDSTLPEGLLDALPPALSFSVDLRSGAGFDSISASQFAQGERNSDVRLRAALIYLVLALSGYMDDVLMEYKAKTACILIDLCSNALAPWISLVFAKIDLAMELLENLLGVIQAGVIILGPRSFPGRIGALLDHISSKAEHTQKRKRSVTPSPPLT